MAKSNKTAITKRKGQKLETINVSRDNARSITIDDFLIQKSSSDVFDDVIWKTGAALITDDSNAIIYEQKNIEVPKSWSPTAINVVASKYFYGKAGTDARESSMRDLINRVGSTIANWGSMAGYFDDETQDKFKQMINYIGINQYGSFNSPVWFNVGLEQYPTGNGTNWRWDDSKQKIVQLKKGEDHKYPQVSACFIQSVADDMDDIMRLAHSEAKLFKYGSGSGTDLSTLRSSREGVHGGGHASGPLSFLRVYDQVAAVVKSGGKTRRAAKMNSLSARHPDIKEFIEAKSKEEKKAWALVREGYDGSFNGEAYDSVFYQNENLSVRVDDEFMKAVLDGGDWQTFEVTTGKPSIKYNAKELMEMIAKGTHLCGDPGMQFNTTINAWHTCPNTAPINASNPCSEYMFVDNSACNLASTNLVKYLTEDGKFDVNSYVSTVDALITAQDILVDAASYPTKEIAQNSHDFRPLGLGYGNLGSLLMRLGLGYDTDEGRSVAAAITALHTGSAYKKSALLAKEVGAFKGFEENREPMLNVIDMHIAALDYVDRDILGKLGLEDVLDKAKSEWSEAKEFGTQYGFRNSQVSVLAPTGTIGFMMDYDTTGIEPELALIKYKGLAGGGMMRLVNEAVSPALRRKGYDEDSIKKIISYLDEEETIEGAPGLNEEDIAVFDCSFKPKKGSRFLSYGAHLKMMGAVQPFLSGAISKTVNMPKDSTVEDIANAYMDGWKMGLKSVAIYRDGSKGIQPLNTGASGDLEKITEKYVPQRRKLPDLRPAVTQRFNIGEHKGYFTVGMYEDGAPGELFITMAKEGTTLGGIMDQFGTAVSWLFQYGVPLNDLVGKFSHARFEPSGWTGDADVQQAKSVVDYIFRKLDILFPGGNYRGDGMQNFNPSDVKIPSTVVADSSENYTFPRSDLIPDKYCLNCHNDTVYKASGGCTEICKTCETVDRAGCSG